jgi:tRNA threonylcarbamoyladenosine biosynthesis protein TsaB
MKTLYIETTTEKSFIAIGDENFFLSIPLLGGPNLSKQLGAEVDKLLKDNNFQPNQIAIGKGPGSLTGIRVGAALGKALAFGWSIPLVEFCTLKIFIPQEEGPFAVLIDARMAGIHVATGVIRDGKLQEWTEPQLQSPSELEKTIEDIPLLISPHPSLIEKRIPRACMEGFIRTISLDLKPPLALR